MILALLVLACSSGPAPEPVVILAGARLTDALPAALESWEGEVTVSLDATSRLARQVQAGAPMDVFLSADVRWMDWLVERELVAADSRRDLLSNRLVLVVPAADTRVTKLGDLASVERLALAGPEVPAGRYARVALEAAAMWPTVERRVVSGQNVRTTLAWVARGEADAGVVYASDALGEPKVRIATDLDCPEPIIYPAALAPHAHPDAAALLAHLASEEVAATWESAGLHPLETP